MKETTIIFLLLISYIFLINYKFFLHIVKSLLVFLIKPQLAILFCLVYLLYVIIFFAKNKSSKFILLATLVLAFLLILEKNLLNHVTNQLNQFIYTFNLEDSNYNQEALNYTKDLIKF